MTAITAEYPVSRWSVPLILTIAVGVSVALIIYAKNLLHQNRIDPGLFFGGKVPAQLETLMAVRVERGDLAEFFDSNTKQKISLLKTIRPSAAKEAASLLGVINLIDKHRLGNAVVSEIEPVILKFAAAQFNVLSAGNVAPTEVPIAQSGISAERFDTTRQARYLMGVVNLNHEQLFFLVLRKGEPVDSESIGALLEKIPGVAIRVRANESVPIS